MSDQGRTAWLISRLELNPLENNIAEAVQYIPDRIFVGDGSPDLDAGEVVGDGGWPLVNRRMPLVKATRLPLEMAAGIYWRPIAEAPRDGRTLLFWCAEGPERCMLGRWGKALHPWEDRLVVGWYFEEHEGVRILRDDVTHFAEITPPEGET